MLIITHTVLFLLSILSQIGYCSLFVIINNHDVGLAPKISNAGFRTAKAFYIMGGIAKVFNLLVMLLFFYMAIQFDGKLLTSYKESFERLQKLTEIAVKKDHTLRKRRTWGDSLIGSLR